jgi:hypothetical protein
MTRGRDSGKCYNKEIPRKYPSYFNKDKQRQARLRQTKAKERERTRENQRQARRLLREKGLIDSAVPRSGSLGVYIHTSAKRRVCKNQMEKGKNQMEKERTIGKKRNGRETDGRKER